MDGAVNAQTIDYLNVIVELFRVLAWPAAAVFILLRFRPEFRQILGSLKKANIASISMEFQKSDPPLDANRFELDIDGMETPYIRHLRENVERYLEDFKDDRRAAYLMYGFVYNYASLLFEKIHRRIFRSQLEALRYLKSEGGVISYDRSVAYFNEMKIHHVQYEDISFDQWSHFLSIYGLVEINEDKVKLTDLGDDFVAYSNNIPDTMIAVV